MTESANCARRAANLAAQNRMWTRSIRHIGAEIGPYEASLAGWDGRGTLAASTGVWALTHRLMEVLL